LLPDDEINVLTGFLTCKDPTEPLPVVLNKSHDNNVDDDLHDSMDHIPQKRSLQQPWATRTGSRDAPIDIRDAPAAYEGQTDQSFSRRQGRPESRTQREETYSSSEENSITEAPAAPRFPGPETSSSYRTRRPSSVAAESTTPRQTSENRHRAVKLELRKVFENEEFVTFRKVAYTGKSTLLPSMTVPMDDGDNVPARSRSSKAHQVLVVTKNKY
jgi:hypothetical protein